MIISFLPRIGYADVITADYEERFIFLKSNPQGGNHETNTNT